MRRRRINRANLAWGKRGDYRRDFMRHFFRGTDSVDNAVMDPVLRTQADELSGLNVAKKATDDQIEKLTKWYNTPDEIKELENVTYIQAKVALSKAKPLG